MKQTKDTIEGTERGRGRNSRRWDRRSNSVLLAARNEDKLFPNIQSLMTLEARAHTKIVGH